MEGEVVEAVLNAVSEMDREELEQLLEAARRRADYLTSKMVLDFKKGDKVSFKHRGLIIAGAVSGQNVKTVTVSTDAGKWRVSPSLLEKVGA